MLDKLPTINSANFHLFCNEGTATRDRTENSIGIGDTKIIKNFTCVGYCIGKMFLITSLHLY